MLKPALLVLGMLMGLSLYAQNNTTATAEHLDQFDNLYSARLYGFKITVTSRFTRNTKGFYEYDFIADSFVGKVAESSQMLWDEQKSILIPQVYSYERSGLGQSKEYNLLFDWKNLRIENLTNNFKFAMPNDQSMNDNLSYQAQLRLDVMKGKKEMRYAIANHKKIYFYQFEVVGEEELDSPLGKVKTIKVKRVQNNDSKSIYAWFAKDFHYLLVCLQQEENGSAYTIFISKANVNGRAIEHF